MPAIAKMTALFELIAHYSKQLSEYSESPESDVKLLVSHILDVEPKELYHLRDRQFADPEKDKINQFIKRRAEGEPVQYITGNCYFYNTEIQVGPGVLIPRPETEVLVDMALKELNAGDKVLDICTGSAAIPIAIKLAKPELEVHASDLSDDALNWAKKNIATTKVDITLKKSDLFSAHNEKFNLITANPPYIAHNESHLLKQNVIDHEPQMALFADNFGLSLIEEIINQAVNMLLPNGSLIMEIGETQAAQCLDIAKENKNISAVIKKDYCQKDRFICLRST